MMPCYPHTTTKTGCWNYSSFAYIFAVCAAIKLFTALPALFCLPDFQPVAVIIKFLFFNVFFGMKKSTFHVFFYHWIFNYCFKIDQISCICLAIFKNVSRKVRSGHRFYSDGAFLQIENNSVSFCKIKLTHIYKGAFCGTPFYFVPRREYGA